MLAETPAWSQVVLQTKSPGRDDFGVAWCADAARGLVVTDYQLVAGETQVRLAGKIDTKEFVAADRGKGLVLLKVPSRSLSELTLAKAKPEPPSPVTLHVAVGTLTGKLTGLESGEDFWLGLADRRSSLPGRDRDTAWLRTDLLYGVRQRGAPLVSEQGQVIGVVVTNDAEDNEFTRAVHVNHVRALLAKGDGPARPLIDLRKFTPSPALGPIPDWTELNLPSSLSKRSRPITDRLQQCLDRQQAELKQIALDQADFNRLGADVSELKGQLKKNEDSQAAINRRVAAIHKSRPLVAYRELKEDQKGIEKDEDRFTYRKALAPLTAEQSAELAALQQTMIQRQAEWRNLSGVEQTTQAQQHAKRDSMVLRKRRERLLPGQLLTLSESAPFESPAQQQAAADWFAAQLRINPGNDIYLVGHSIALVPLRKYELALQQLDTALQKVDEVPRAAIGAARARVLLRMGRADEGKTELAAALKAGPSDPLVLHWAGLAACEGGHFVKGAEYLQAALEKGGDPAAIQIALAVVHATAPPAEARSGDKALLYATRACELTEWQDWRALLASAAAYAERQEWPHALQAAEQALQLAPADDQALCNQWRNLVAAGKSIREVWPLAP